MIERVKKFDWIKDNSDRLSKKALKELRGGDGEEGAVCTYHCELW